MAQFPGENMHMRPTMSSAVLRFERVALHLPGEVSPRFEGLSFMLPHASAIVLTGALGSGKSSALRMIIGSERPTTGRVQVGEQDPAKLDQGALEELRTHIGYMPENGALLSNLNLFENMVLPFRYHREPTEEEVHQRAAETLELLAMPPLPAMIPPQASSTLRRQVALARAVILRPPVLVLDSPVAGMDHASAANLWRTLNRLRETMPVAIVIAADFPPQQANLEHRLINLSDHRARWTG